MGENQVQIFADGHFSPKIFNISTISAGNFQSIRHISWAGTLGVTWTSTGFSHNIHKKFANTAVKFS
jgi:hypothetical protein